jgi:hypothetical protein
MDFQAKQIAPPKSWEEFEELCLVLFRAIWKDPTAYKNGRRGQPQHGVDIVVMLGRTSGAYCGIQCKGKDAGYGNVLTITELNSEVEKADLFTPPLKELIVATTAPRDVHLQQHARELSEARAKRGRFRVQVLAWEDIQSLLAEYPAVIKRFYREHAYDIDALLSAMQAMPKGQDVAEMLALVRQHVGADRHVLTNKVSQWRPITFVRSRDLGPALLGRGLGPSDATACPQLVEADTVVRQLRRAFSARLVGEPGSGKSVCAYQAALTLRSQGWLVVRLGDPRVANVSLASPEDKPTLFLVDDAHLMAQDVLRDLEDQACPTKLLLTVHTALDRIATHRGAIPMDGTRAVQTIAAALKSNLRKTLAAVKRFDKHVGEGSWDEDLVRRIDDAQMSSRFPWQFCFVLGGGWRRANEAADASRFYGADLILAIAATQQLASRDAQTPKETMLRLGFLAGLTADEIQRGLTWLVQERLLLAENDLRCPHQRFSAAIVGTIYSRWAASKRQVFTRLCRAILIDEATTLAGASALIQELRHFSRFDLPRTFELESLWWIDEETQAALLARCWGASTAEDRMFACLTLATLGGERNKWQDLVPSTRIQQLGAWFSEAAHPMGLGLGRLLNNIYNADKFLAAQIVSAADPAAVAGLASAINATTAYTVGEMIDRMALACTTAWKQLFNAALERSRILHTVAHWPEGQHIADFSQYCWALSLYDNEFAFEVLQTAMPLLQHALAADPMKVFPELDEIARYLLRVWDPLGINTGKLAPDRRQRALAQELCRHIDCTTVAAKISSTASRREFEQAARFLGFFRRADPKRAATLCRQLDWSRLGATIGAEWSHLTHDSTVFMCQAALDKQSREIVTSVIQAHLADIRVMPSQIAVLAPELACAVVDQGGTIAIGADMAYGASWRRAAYVIYKFSELRPDLVHVLVTPYEAEAATSLQSRQINVLDDADVFLRVMDEVAPDALARILARVEPGAADAAWVTCLAKGGKAGRSAAILIEHCQTMPGELGKVARRLRQRFPKASIPRPDKSSMDQ